MSEQHPPLPDIKDGTGHLGSDVRGVFLRSDVGVHVHAQTTEDGSYLTSVLTIGGGMSRLDIFARRDQMERLHRLLGEHLEQLDAYETALYTMRLERDGLAADVPDDVKRAAMEALAAKPRYVVERDETTFYVIDARSPDFPGPAIVFSTMREAEADKARDHLNAGGSLADLDDVLDGPEEADRLITGPPNPAVLNPAGQEKSCPECRHPMMSGPLEARGSNRPEGSPKIIVAWWCANCHYAIVSNDEAAVAEARAILADPGHAHKYAQVVIDTARAVVAEDARREAEASETGGEEGR